MEYGGWFISRTATMYCLSVLAVNSDDQIMSTPSSDLATTVPRRRSMSTPRRSSRITEKSRISKQPRISKKPSKDVKKPPPAKKPPLGQPALLYLRVSRRFLNLLPAVTEDQPNPQPLPPPPGAMGHLIVIRASLQDLRPFTGVTVDWLIRIARLIFEPLGTSSLFTFTEDTLESWLVRDMNPAQWRRVEQGELLRATIYEFRPNNNAFITLSKISLRQEKSVTTDADVSQQQATAFRDTIRARDTRCIITRNPFFELVITASHLIPKRLGDAAVTSVVQRFTGLDDVVTRYDPTIGVLLSKQLD